MSVSSAATTPPRRFWHTWVRFPVDLWWRSLPLRVIASVFVASVLVLDRSGGLQRLGLTVVDAWHVVVACWVLRRR